MAVRPAASGNVIRSWSRATCDGADGMEKVFLNESDHRTADPPSTARMPIQAPMTVHFLRKHQRPRAYNQADMWGPPRSGR